MKAIVDKDLCGGCGVCPGICPEVFEMEGDLARVLCETVPVEVEESCREAAESCPVEAISIEE